MISIVVISKDEPSLEYTLSALSRIREQRDDVEVVVVDASTRRLDYLRDDSAVTWVEYAQPENVRVTIPHQRNVGVGKAQGDIIVFTDAGCEPDDGWFEALTGPIISGREQMVAGVALSRSGESSYDADQRKQSSGYVEECPTINVAFLREVFDRVDGFDETFSYGSDVDFSWRVRNAEFRIFRNADAVVSHDWGSRKRQAKRSFAYGRARAHLYLKHRDRWQTLLRNDPIAVVYPLFLIGLPITVKFRGYPLLLLIPLLKNRRNRPMQVITDHLVYGAGVLRQLVSK